jgi:DNA invertase Pin-like site-specific DNA recombinase
MTHVLAYFRQSDEEGAKKQLSIPAQQERFLGDVAGRDVTYEVAPWDEGYSGGSLDRPGLQWILANLDRADELWVYDHDRLVRHPFFGPYVMNEIRSRGIRMWGPWGEDVASPMGRFMTDIRMRFGAYYREEVSDRTKMNRDHRLKEGLWSGHPPTGYKFVFEQGEGSRRILVPDPESAPKVRAIFRMLAEGRSQREACRLLGMSQTNVIWQKGNPLYIGLVYKLRANVDDLETRTHEALWTLATDETVDWLYPGRHEPLVEAETWDAIELQRRTSPANRVSTVYGLSGRIRCGECGGVLRIARNKGKRSDSLRCERCKWERSYKYGENAVLTALAIVTDSPEFERAVEEELTKEQKPQETNELDALIAERGKVAKQLDRALDLLLEADDLSGDVRQRAVGLKGRRDHLDKQVAAMKAEGAARPTALRAWRQTKVSLTSKPVAELWAVSTPPEQRELLMGVFSQIQATRDRLTFQVRGLEIAFEVAWLKGDVPYREVAGPGFEPGTP